MSVPPLAQLVLDNQLKTIYNQVNSDFDLICFDPKTQLYAN